MGGVLELWESSKFSPLFLCSIPKGGNTMTLHHPSVCVIAKKTIFSVTRIFLGIAFFVPLLHHFHGTYYVYYLNTVLLSITRKKTNIIVHYSICTQLTAIFELFRLHTSFSNI